mmetsp:Transcript_83471/g.190395  ORF Transcript_83471/g.190395 Transcript_83471/m.190395 type:complete len:206 (-) Transcript_83471:177-794(-)
MRSARFGSSLLLSSASEMVARRLVIAPGNGCSDIRRSNWYGWLHDKVKSEGLFEEVKCENFPDPYDAKREVWLPFMEKDLQADSEAVIVGHSSGAEAAMRYAETHKVHGIVLVSACHTDLGDAGERASGYYPPSGGDWKWDDIRENCGYIVQFHSKDDHLVPVSEGRHVAEQLKSEYHELDGHSHFFDPFDKLLEVLRAKQAESK